MDTALALFAQCVNRRHYEPLHRLLRDDTVYESHNHLYRLRGADSIVDWLEERAKSRDEAAPERQIGAFCGYFMSDRAFGPALRPCVLITRGDRRSVETLFAFEMRLGRVLRMQGLDPRGLSYTRGSKPE